MNHLKEAFHRWAGEACIDIAGLPASGSERRYWRLKGRSETAIAAYHPVPEEINAFLLFSQHFRQIGLNVPEIYFADTRRHLYLMEDLGDVSLFSLLVGRPGSGVDDETVSYLKMALDELIKFQVIGHKGIDYSASYPCQAFDRQSVAWDLNYFKYNFLKLETPFNEQKLEDDFIRLTDFLMEAPGEYFMYRDFQSRNIMIRDGKLFFIDYQGGRKGQLHYDPASLLFQVRTDLPFELRDELLEHYLDNLNKVVPVERSEFLRYYDGFVLLRLLQVMGAYGFRGLIQKKNHFVASIPFAVKNIRWFLENRRLAVELPELMKGLGHIVDKQGRFKETTNDDSVLTISIGSFSYKHGMPEDPGGHGGGFVFDCRALPNPGREEHLRHYNGKDAIIAAYLEERDEVNRFLEHIFGIVSQSLTEYQQRGFNHLSVNFGCTGGQHRSVYCAERLSVMVRKEFPAVAVRLTHRELS